jgi:hypothetical protein
VREWSILGDDADDIQVVTQSTRAENAHCEEVTTHISVAAENVGECLVAVFFLQISKVWISNRGSGDDA